MSLIHFVPDAYRANILAIFAEANRKGWSDRLLAYLVLGSANKYPTVYRWRKGLTVPSDPEAIARWLQVPAQDLLWKDLRDRTLPFAPEVALTGVKVYATAERRKAREPAPAPIPAPPVKPARSLPAGPGPVWTRAGAR